MTKKTDARTKRLEEEVTQEKEKTKKFRLRMEELDDILNPQNGKHPRGKTQRQDKEDDNLQ